MYLELFHGRNKINETLDDWGFDGPIIGPFDNIHMTYLNVIRLNSRNFKPETWFLLEQEHELIEFRGKFYGDFAISKEIQEEEKARLVTFEEFTKEATAIEIEKKPFCPHCIVLLEQLEPPNWRCPKCWSLFEWGGQSIKTD